MRELAPPASPWTNAYGLSRTVLAVAMLLTLAGNSADTLFRPLGITNDDLLATVSLSRISLFHLVGPRHLGYGKAIATIILCLAASGWRPRLTGVLHWWVAASFAASTILIDGGDQANAVLTLLLLPVTLTDPRRWHWSAPASTSSHRTLGLVVARSCFTMVRAQMAIIYFVASTSKFSSTEWANGTALYYWFTQPVFGMDLGLRRFAVPLLAERVIVVPATWGVLALEITLAGLLFASHHTRRKWLFIAIAFHGAIAVVHGLVTFAMTMMAGLWLYLRCPEHSIHLPRRLRVRSTVGEPPGEGDAVSAEVLPDVHGRLAG